MWESDEGEVLARTIYGEARGEYLRKDGGLSALIAVGNVVLNRVHQQTWFGKTIVEVCRKPWQFSCWNEKDPNYKVVTQKTLSDNLFTFCKKVANGLIYKDWPDLTKGSDHYHSSLLPILPKWTVHQTAQIQIGRHIFYKLEVK